MVLVAAAATSKKRNPRLKDGEAVDLLALPALEVPPGV